MSVLLVNLVEFVTTTLEIGQNPPFYEVNKWQGRHKRQGSQGLVLGWILRNKKHRQQWRCLGEVAATMACQNSTMTALSEPKNGLAHGGNSKKKSVV